MSAVPPEPEPFDLTSFDVARRLAIHVSTVAEWAEKGVLPFWRTPGGHRRFRRSDVERLAQPDEVRG